MTDFKHIEQGERHHIEVATDDMDITAEPWQAVARIPCMTMDTLGNPYNGVAELRVALPNYHSVEGFPPVHLHCLFPFGPLAESSQAANLGGYALTVAEARSLGEQLIRAANAAECAE